MESKKSRRKSKGPKKYKVSPLAEQSPQLVHEQLVVRDKRVYYVQWLFRRDEFQCGSCRDNTNVVFSRQPPINNVVKSCTHCGVTEIVDPEDQQGNAVAVQLIEPRPIRDIDVKAFVKRNRIMKQFLKPDILRIYEKKPKKAVNLEDIELELEE